MRKKTKKQSYKILLATIILWSVFGFVGRSQASITKEISYQGKLTNTSGVAVADGTYNMKISIYDAVSSGNCLWTARGNCSTPTAKSVTVSNGIFSIMLGESGDNALSLDFNSAYWLGVTVGSDAEMSPRKKIGASAYAFNADLLDGLDSKTSGADAHILATDSSGNIIVSGNTTTNSNVYFNGTTYYINSSGTGNLNALTLNGNLTLSTHDIATDTTTGTKIGTATNQKLGFFNATPVVQQTGNVLTALSNLGLVTSPTLTSANVGLGNVENTALSTWAGTSNITTLGTIATGTWHGTAIDGTYINYNTTNLQVSSSKLNTIQDIATSSSPTFAGVKLSSGSYTATLKSGTLSANKTFTFPTAYPASTAFLKMDTSGNITTDTNTYLTSLSGALLADGTVPGATSQSQEFVNGANVSSGIFGQSYTPADYGAGSVTGGSFSLNYTGPYSDTTGPNMTAVSGIVTSNVDEFWENDANHYGGYFQVSGRMSPDGYTVNSYGLSAIADSYGGSTNFGIYASASGANDNYAGYFDNGNVYIAGSITHGTWNGTAIDGSYVNYNTTNLKVSSSKLNTIQDIATGSTPTFLGLTLTGGAGKLSISTSAYDAVSISSSNSSTDPGLFLASTNSTTQSWGWIIQRNAKYLMLYDATNGKYPIYVEPNVTSGSIYIKSNKVGILNTNPAYALDINGIVYTNNEIWSASNIWAGRGGNYIELTAGSPGIIKSYQALAIQPNIASSGGVIATFNATGLRVGDTSAPSYTLDVAGNAYASGYILSNTYVQANGTFTETSGSVNKAIIGVTGSSARLYLDNTSGTAWEIDNYNGSLRFFNPSNVRMTLDTGGSLTATGTITGQSSTSGLKILAGKSTDSGTAVQISMGDSTGTYTNLINTVNSSTVANNSIQFYTYATSSTWNKAVEFKGDKSALFYGNVGIGSTGPTAKLQVVGDAGATGADAQSALNVTGGQGGSGSTSNGYVGGTITMTGGIGGTSAMDYNGGVGGSLTFAGGAGGTGYGNGGNGGAIYLNGGAGGTGVNGLAGSSGNVYLANLRGNVKIGDSSTNSSATLTVASLTSNGAVYSNGGTLTNTNPSDERLKKNIENLDSVLPGIMQLRPVSFEWKSNGETARGFIAQEVEKIFPELVGEGLNGYKGLYTDQFIPYLTKAIQEQQKEIQTNQTSISGLDLKTTENISNLSDLQKTIDEQLNKITDKFSNIKEDLNNQNDLINDLQKQLAVLKTQANTDLNLAQLESNTQDILYIKSLLGLDGDGVIPGNVSILGTLKAEKVTVSGVETLQMTVVNDDTDSKTIGEVEIKPEDEGDSDGKSAEVKTKAITKNSKIFVSPKGDTPVNWIISDINDGKGFEILLDKPVEKTVSFQWWIVEEK